MKNNNTIYKFISKVYKALMNRASLTGFIILAEIISVFLFFMFFSAYSIIIATLNIIITIAVLFNLLNKNTHPSYKLAWSIIVLLFPFAGGASYLIFANKRIPKRLRNIELLEIKDLNEKDYSSVSLNKDLKEYDTQLLKTLTGLKNTTYYNFYKNTKTKYYASGKEMFEEAIEDLKLAKEFILLEFFIVADGELYKEIFEVLKNRILNGVDVYLIFDDFGSITTMNYKLYNELKNIGVHITAFNPMRIGSVSKLNYRTHRKIIDIDNRIAYTGGINLADEYVDKKIRFGKWKDTACKVEGEACNNFTLMFFQNYCAINNLEFSSDKYMKKKHLIASDEIVMPFSVSPTDDYSIARNIHLNLLSLAKESFHIHTPYLIIDYGMTNALINAANSGVEVIITVPSIPDKKIVNLVTKCNYEKLLKNGIKIYEYKPGFLHSKSCIIDGKILLMSGINMDFRSYFLNYESGVIVANSPTAKMAEDDFLNTLDESDEITLDSLKNRPYVLKLLGHLFSLFAPLI